MVGVSLCPRFLPLFVHPPCLFDSSSLVSASSLSPFCSVVERFSPVQHTHTHTNVVLARIPSCRFIIFFALLLFFIQPLSRHTLVVSCIHVFPWTRCTNVPTIVSSTRRTDRERDWRPRGIVKNFPCNRRETRSLPGGWGQGARKAAKCKPVIPCTLWLN